MPISFQQIDELLKLDLCARAKLAYIIIAKNKLGFTTHRSTLLKQLGVSENTLDRTISSLHRVGLLEKPQRQKNGKFRSGYRLTNPPNLGNGAIPPRLGSSTDNTRSRATKAEVAALTKSLIDLWKTQNLLSNDNEVRRAVNKAIKKAPVSTIEEAAKRHIGKNLMHGEKSIALCDWIKQEQYLSVIELAATK